MIETATPSGLHEFVGERILARYARPGLRAADLGAGPGAIATRLKSLGLEVIAVDRTAEGYKADCPHVVLDLNLQDVASYLGPKRFDLVTAIEVIEHLENPVGFLRNVGRLLSPQGVAVLTTPNVDSLPARAKFCLTGKIRTMDERSDPTHISPIFWELFNRHFLSLAGVELREHLVFPQNGYQLTRGLVAWVFRLASHLFSGECLLGDHHVLVIGASP